MMIKNNIYLVFQIFSDIEPLDTDKIEEIRQEWARYVINNRNENNKNHN